MCPRSRPTATRLTLALPPPASAWFTGAGLQRGARARTIPHHPRRRHRRRGWAPHRGGMDRVHSDRWHGRQHPVCPDRQGRLVPGRSRGHRRERDPTGQRTDQHAGRRQALRAVLLTHPPQDSARARWPARDRSSGRGGALPGHAPRPAATHGATNSASGAEP